MMGQPQVHLPVFFSIEQKIIRLAKMAVSGTGTDLKRGLTRKSVTDALKSLQDTEQNHLAVAQ
jgi:hypothetical protein